MSDDDSILDNSISKKSRHKKNNDKSKYIRGSFSYKMYIAEEIIDNFHRNIKFIEKMKKVGYHQEKIEQFSTIYLTANEFHNIQKRIHGEKIGEYHCFEQILASTKEELNYLCKVAKIALRKYPEKIDKLKIKDKRGNSMADLFNFMEQLYSQIFEDSVILEQFAAFGYSGDQIGEYRNNFIKTREAYKNYCSTSAKAVESTRVRNLKIAELDEWMLDFFTLSKVII